MRVAIASGKGGTGKTTVAVNLAAYVAAAGWPVTLLDCDAEDPDDAIFLRAPLKRRDFEVDIPRVDEAKCDFCGKCGAACRFNALAVLKAEVLIFPELCHNCGACWEVCPRGALAPMPRAIGTVGEGRIEGVRLVEGRLHIGERTAVPLIHEVLRRAPASGLTIVDAAPGVSCPMVAGVRGADAVVLVTEPTPFGLYDVRLAADVVRRVGVPFGVFINRDADAFPDLRAWCRDDGIAIWGELPDDRAIAETYAAGELIVRALPAYRPGFERLWHTIEALCPSGN